MKRLIYFFIFCLIISFSLFAQRKDLTGLKFCIDPGHGGHSEATDRHVVPDPGVDFWESESNFQKALLLEPMLEALGATVILTRYTNDYPNDADEPTLAARVQTANSNNVDWFHSIHSNALPTTNNNTNYTLVMVREKRSSDPYEQYANGLGVPERQESWTMAVLMGPKIKAFNRTTSATPVLDWTFYGGTNGGFSLGVLRGLSMPGELSEGSFHDYYPETRRLMNNDYRKVEAYALRNSFMSYFGVPADTLCIVEGILTDNVTGIPVNNIKVRIMPGNLTYNGDTYKNGFFMFDKLPAGQYTLYFETAHYLKDSVIVTLTPGTPNFKDRTIMNMNPPYIASSTPSNGDSSISVYNPITINFNKAMDTASARKAFSISPVTPGTFSWTNSNMSLVFTSSSILQSLTFYTVKIDTSAMDIGGNKLDGNGDGIAGDPFVMKFKTLISDAERPFVASSSPSKTSTTSDFPLNGVITMTFNRLMDTTSFAGNILFRKFSVDVPADQYYTNYNGRTIVTIVPKAPMDKSSTYLVVATNLVRDINKNTMKTLYYFYVNTGTRAYKNIQTLESFSGGIANWKTPTYSGSTVGVVPDSTSNTEENTFYLPGMGDKKSMAINYTWTTTGTDFLLREYLFQGTPYTTLIDTSFVLQTYVFGDSSNNKFRFAVDDSSTLVSHKVNNWVTIDWFGWKLIEWKLTNFVEMGNWLIYSPIVGPKNRFDSYQFTYDPVKGNRKGTIYLDELRIAEIDKSLSVHEVGNVVPTQIELMQNYPNPFNPSTKIRFRIDNYDFVTLKIFDALGREKSILVNQSMSPGEYVTDFDAKSLTSGTYFYTLTTSKGSLTKKMALLK